MGRKRETKKRDSKFDIQISWTDSSSRIWNHVVSKKRNSGQINTIFWTKSWILDGNARNKSKWKMLKFTSRELIKKAEEVQRVKFKIPTNFPGNTTRDLLI